LEQLDAIAERVVNVGAVVACEQVVGLRRVSGGFEAGDERRQIIDEQSRMRLLRGTEVVFDAEVKFEGADLEPETAAFIQSGRLGDFREAEEIAVERAALFFFAVRHRKLDVVDGGGGHYSLSYFKSRRKHRPPSMSKTTQESIGFE
jgi:hypothetical protein